MGRPKENVPVPDGFLEAVNSGDRLKTLKAIRALLANGIDTKPAARDLPGIYRLMMTVLDRIDELEHRERERERGRLQDGNAIVMPMSRR